MLRTKTDKLSRSAIALGCLTLLSLASGCTAEPADDQSDSAATLGLEIPSCSIPASSGYDTTTSNLTLSMGSDTNLVLGVVRGFLFVNGRTCTKPNGTDLTPAMVKRITIVGSPGDDKVAIDTLTGALGPSILGAAGGIVIDLGASSAGDEFSLRGSAAVDRWLAGEQGGDTYFEISGDRAADIKVSHAEFININLGDGNDIFDASGPSPALSATHLNGGVATSVSSPVALGITIGGGEGNDTITGGNGNDTVNGGGGNDTFKARSGVDGDDTFNGGDGTDSADYGARSGPVTAALDGTTDSGESGEKDHLALDVEDLLGGHGNDVLTGNVSSNHVRGGEGDDRLSGGVNGGACAGDVDALDGESGDDTFDQGSAPDCADTLNGGVGTDRVDYQGRSGNLSIALDGLANDGEPAGAGEKDNVKTDVEIVIGGGGDDQIKGSAANDELHGGPGNDVLSGGAGNDVLCGDSGNDVLNGETGDDTFDESGVDPEYLVADDKGAGNDVMNGGTHDGLGHDTVDYSARTTAITATICMDSTKPTGAATTSLTGTCADNDGEPSASEHDKLVNMSHLIGGSAGDTLSGGSGNDLLEGRDGDDTLNGGGANDILFGDNGNDSLFGDDGDDTLDGGAATTKDQLEGGTGANGGDGDICIAKAGDDVFDCEL
ncbi:MAG TPA: calcium-binding protein [Polyangiaceae bacterium]|nr:calcium-binding protein [Polyangiaceae bacterium]